MIVLDLFKFLVDQLPLIAHAAVSASIPIALAGMTGVICERSGVVNIGLEGIMLTAAFVGWATGVAAVALLPPDLRGATPVFGISLPLLIALAAALVSAMVLSAVHAWLSISVKADQIVSGVIINVTAVGLTGYLNILISANSPEGAGGFTPFDLPTQIANLPFVGWLLNAILNQGPITISAFLIMIFLQIWLFRTRWGLRTRAVGEHPRAAETVGIDVIRLRYRNVILAGLLAGLGGAYLSMEQTTSFQDNMTQGAGYIGLAAMIVGRWTPVGAMGAALLFASSRAVARAIIFTSPTTDVGAFLKGIPPQFWDALPYLATIIILAGVIGRSIPPAADGRPYERESAT